MVTNIKTVQPGFIELQPSSSSVYILGNNILGEPFIMLAVYTVEVEK